MRRYWTAVSALFLLSSLATTAPAVAQVPGLSIGGEVTVVDPGAEPRQSLRYVYVEGKTETMEVDIAMSMDMNLSGTEMMQMDLPMSMAMTSTITDVSDDGVARAEFELTDFSFGAIGMALDGEQVADAGDLAADEMNAQAEAMIGVTGWMEVDDRGRVLDLGLDLPADLPPEVAQQSQQAVIQTRPLPEEPVGVGAVWESAMAIDQSGLGMDVNIISEIVELDDSGFRTDETFSMDLEAASEAFDLIPGLELSIDEFTVEGGGSSDIRLDRISQAAEMEMQMRMAMSAAVEGEGMDIAMDLDLSMASTVTDQ